METLNDFIAQYPASADGYLRRASQRLFMSREDVSMDKVAADMDKALEVAAKKDDVYYNRAKIIYNYALGKPEKVYKDWSLDKALGEVRKAIAIDEGVTEELKRTQQMEWVRRCNNIHNRAEEIGRASCRERV